MVLDDRQDGSVLTIGVSKTFEQPRVEGSIRVTYSNMIEIVITVEEKKMSPVSSERGKYGRKTKWKRKKNIN